MTPRPDDTRSEISIGYAHGPDGTPAPPGRNVYWQDTRIGRADRERRRGQRGTVLWFTGLSGAGKSTLASAVEEALFNEGYFTYVLDGDNVRHGLNRDLDFSPSARTENIRRIGEVAKLFADAGVLVATAFISPYQADRDGVRALMNRPGDFVEVFVSCPLEVCESRDPKGLYQRARAGEITNFTGIDAPYQQPEAPELVVRTDRGDVGDCVDQILTYLRAEGYIRQSSGRAVGEE